MKKSKIRINVVFCGCPPETDGVYPKGGLVLKVGLDVGSTTIKCVVLDDAEKII